MPRKPTSPVAAQAAAIAHARTTIDACTRIIDTLQGKDDANLAALAKTLEAAGCYIRRADDRGLLRP